MSAPASEARVEGWSAKTGSPVITSFVSSDVELLEEMNRQAGWRSEYRQLEAGRLQTAAASRDLGAVTILRERSNRRLEVAAETADRVVSVVIPVNPGDVSLNGSRSALGFGVFTPGAELHAVTHSAVEAFNLQIPAAIFANHERCLGAERESWRGPAEVLQGEPQTAGRLRSLLGAAWRFEGAGPAEAELASRILEAVVTSREVAFPVSTRVTPRPLEILRVAREYIEAHLVSPIGMADVCEAVGTSVRTLERVFRRELQVGPVAYIRSRRLAAVRKALKHPGARNQPIARIAANHGFAHLGRFSGYYRQHFGELPSATRGSCRGAGVTKIG